MIKRISQDQKSTLIDTEYVVADEEGPPLPFEHSSFDLIFSSMNLHWVNDIPGVLQQVYHAENKKDVKI